MGGGSLFCLDSRTTCRSVTEGRVSRGRERWEGVVYSAWIHGLHAVV